MNKTLEEWREYIGDDLVAAYCCVLDDIMYGQENDKFISSLLRVTTQRAVRTDSAAVLERFTAALRGMANECHELAAYAEQWLIAKE